MLPSQREKLLHAILFFKENTLHFHKLKIYKLLHFLDFEIYRQTGKTTTGLPYFAYPMGPVPKQLQGEFRAPLSDMRAVMTVHLAPTDDPDRDGPLTIYPKIKASRAKFTKREMKEMERLAEIYREATGELMSKASHGRSHRHGYPWYQVHDVEGREWAEIPYMLALDGQPGSITKEQADEIDEESRYLAALLG